MTHTKEGQEVAVDKTEQSASISPGHKLKFPEEVKERRAFQDLSSNVKQLLTDLQVKLAEAARTTPGAELNKATFKPEVRNSLARIVVDEAQQEILKRIAKFERKQQQELVARFVKQQEQAVTNGVFDVYLKPEERSKAKAKIQSHGQEVKELVGRESSRKGFPSKRVVTILQNGRLRLLRESGAEQGRFESEKDIIDEEITEAIVKCPGVTSQVEEMSRPILRHYEQSARQQFDKPLTGPQDTALETYRGAVADVKRVGCFLGELERARLAYSETISGFGKKADELCGDVRSLIKERGRYSQPDLERDLASITKLIRTTD